MSDPFDFADDLGPAKIIHVHEPTVDLRGIVVVDNVATGPSIGGLRMASDVSLAECFRLARAMTMKNAAAGLAHGGGKSVIFADPRTPDEQKERLLRTFASALRFDSDYIFGPDMGTNEECMAWVRDEIGRAVGLPREVGGIPLDEIGATGWGLVHATEIAADHCGLDLNGARVAIQGFGAVGKHAARFLESRGAVVVAANDSKGAIQNPEGLDVAALTAIKAEGGSVVDHGDGEKLDRDALIGVECEVWVPAARPDAINDDNMQQLRARLVVPGANIAVTATAEQYLHEHDVLCVPDFIANAGGVICAAMEYHGATEASAMQSIEEKIRSNTKAVLKRSRSEEILPRQAAVELATERVRRAMSFRRHGLFSSAPDFI
ncbi:MAG: Glu/Leu/Phe/Val dehydrogenase [Chromatiales bacterium]|nr:MAG: Glu/Leu/Phe/Val dehydrogenase [Chromatiales bacterium]